MTYLSKNAAIIKIKILQNSNAATYFETNERLFLQNTLEKLEYSSESTVDSELAQKLLETYKKYQKYI